MSAQASAPARALKRQPVRPKDVPHHAEAFDTPMDFAMGSWAEAAAFERDALARFPELRACRDAGHALQDQRLAFATGPVRTVGCWKCRTVAYRGAVVPIAAAFGAEWTGPVPVAA